MERKNLHNSILGLAIEYKNTIAGKSPEFSGDLKSSIKFDRYDDEAGFEITGNSYFKFMDKGVNGVKQSVGSPYSYRDKKPPLLIEWSKAKGLNPFAVQNSIYNKGIKPRLILEKTMKNVKNVGERIGMGYAKDLAEELKEKYK